ncbi:MULTISPECIES: tetratricopeptide repeat protein [Amycolatopsis]|uniref:Tetratricopeptide repeat-containing protein n=2 Tax=Amycolatopsis TaxID=1813 RepID=A0A1I4BZ84_9PSEU|nr:tetratricopeptide repeat protein [Amycolatopsis sacchari]SFK74092.1 Tetratricopeptide repeat-containing protein [Amycolatopsis sacchari]
MNVRRFLAWLRGLSSRRRPAGPTAPAESGPLSPWPARPPQAPRRLVGRERHLRVLDEQVGRNRMVAVVGARGTGKTALVSYWVSHHTTAFELYADLNGTVSDGQTEAVLSGFLHKLDVSLNSVDPADLPELFRSVTAATRVVVVLDNAASAPQVNALLPAPGNEVLVTSRRPVDALAAGATVELGPLTFAEARSMLEGFLGAAVVAEDPHATWRVTESCGRLPLALRIAGDLAAREKLSMTALARKLESAGAEVRVVTTIDADLSSAMGASYDGLTKEAARTFRLLGSQPCAALHKYAVAALVDRELTVTIAALDELLRYQLIEIHDDRVKLQSALRDYAAEQASAAEKAAGFAGLLRWYIANVAAAGNALAPDWAGPAIEVDEEGLHLLEFSQERYREAVGWCRSELASALALVRAAEHGHSDAWKLPVLFMPYLFLSKHWSSCLDLARLGVKIARNAGDLVGLARCLHNFSWVLHALNRDQEALPCLRESAQLHGMLTDDRGRAWTSFALGESLTAVNELAEARECFERALTHFEETKWRFGEAIVLASLAVTLEKQGDVRQAFAAAEKALKIAQAVGISPLQSHSHHQLGLLHQREGNQEAAVGHFQRALVLRRKFNERWNEADTELSLGEAYGALERYDEAYAAFDRAEEIFAELHDDARRLVVHAARANLEVAPKPFQRE